MQELQQGASETIRVDDIVDAAGAPLDVTGWTVHAQARPGRTSSVLFAEWSTDPEGDQELATAEDSAVVLSCPHEASTGWELWAGRTAFVGIELTSPSDQRVSFEARVRLKREIVLDP